MWRVFYFLIILMYWLELWDTCEKGAIEINLLLLLLIYYISENVADISSLNDTLHLFGWGSRQCLLTGRSLLIRLDHVQNQAIRAILKKSSIQRFVNETLVSFQTLNIQESLMVRGRADCICWQDILWWYSGEWALSFRCCLLQIAVW